MEEKQRQQHLAEGSLSLSPFRTTREGSTPVVRASTVTPSSPSPSSPSSTEEEEREGTGITEGNVLGQERSKAPSTFLEDFVLSSSSTTKPYRVGSSSEVVEDDDGRPNRDDAEGKRHTLGGNAVTNPKDRRERDGEKPNEEAVDASQKRFTIAPCPPLFAATKTASMASLQDDGLLREKDEVASPTFPTGVVPSSPLSAVRWNSNASPVSSPMQSLTTPAYPMPPNKALEESPTRLRRVREKNDPNGSGLPSRAYSPLSFSVDDSRSFSPTATAPLSHQTSPTPADGASSGASASPAAGATAPATRWTSLGSPPTHLASTTTTSPKSAEKAPSSPHSSDHRRGSRNENGSRGAAEGGEPQGSSAVASFPPPPSSSSLATASDSPHPYPFPPSIRLHAAHIASSAAAPPDALTSSFTEKKEEEEVASWANASKDLHRDPTATWTKGIRNTTTPALIPSSVPLHDRSGGEAATLPFPLSSLPKAADEGEEEGSLVGDGRPRGEAERRSRGADSPEAPLIPPESTGTPASAVPPLLLPSPSSSSPPASSFSFSKPTSPRAFRYVMLQKERETSALRDTNARQQSMVSTLKESLQQVHQQLAKQAEWFAEERTQAEKDRDTQLTNVMEQLRVVRQSAEILLSEKRGMLEESKRQQTQLLSMVEQERREKENIMQEYRDKTEGIITKQGQEITRLRRKLTEIEEALELWKIQQIAKEEDLEKLQDTHRIVLREKEELKVALTRLQQRHLQETQEREAAEATAREVGFKGMEETVERNRKLTQQLQTLEQQLQEQRRAHEGQEEKLLEAHRQERHTLEERLRSVIAEREAAVESATAQQNRTAELHQLRTSLEAEMKEKLQQVKGAAESALQEEQQKCRTAEEKWAEEREKLERTVEAQQQQLQRLQLTHQERQKSTTTLQQELRERSWAATQEQVWREMFESRARLANTILWEQASLHLSGQAALHDRLVVAPLRATIATMENAIREREMAMQQAIGTERQRHEDAVAEMEKILVELRVDRHRAQTLATQYLKELTTMHREKEQSRVHLEGEVEKLEKRITTLEKELQYREMVNTEQQGTMKMLHGRLENYERENKSLHEEVLEQSQKIQEAHIWLGRKDAGINQLRAQLRAFEATSHGGSTTGSSKKIGGGGVGVDGAMFFSSTIPQKGSSPPPAGRETVPMLTLTGGEEPKLRETGDE